MLKKSSVTKLNNFFCGLHVLVHAAETAPLLIGKMKTFEFLSKFRSFITQQAS
jgi:hypothetical protein